MVGETNKQDRRRADHRTPDTRPNLIEFPERGAPDFGELLRRYRLRAGLSQANLAERASLSERAISDLERGLKARPQAATIGLLAKALDLAPGEREQMAAAARRETAPRRPGAAASPVNAPELLRPTLPTPLTRFIGREHELAAVHRLLDDGARLITLTGTGGCGKTRLALEVARGAVGKFPDGAWAVELAALTDPALVPGTIMRALGLRERPGQANTDALHAALREKALLLVLDNCEHLIDACAAIIAALLAAAPHVVVLATSREALQIPGEIVWRVPTLSVPTASRAEKSDPLGSAAVQFLIDRIGLHRQDYAPTMAEAAELAGICRRLGGVPLALELVAARIATLGSAQVAARLDRALDLLSSKRRGGPPHHQTLRAALDWSYQLLATEEALLLDRLAVFAGGWTLAAVEAICGDGIGDVPDTLAQLVEKSLVFTDASPGEPRYALLETLRQYAGEHLAATEKATSCQAAHATYFLALAREAAPQLHGPQQDEWFKRLEREHDNFRAAFRHFATQGQSEEGLALVGALWIFWFRRGFAHEGLHWAKTFLDLAGEGTPALRAEAHRSAAHLAYADGDQDAAQHHLTASRALYAALSQDEQLPGLLNAQGILDEARGDRAAARACYTESLALARRYGDGWVAAAAALNLGECCRTDGQLAEAEELFAASARDFRAIGDHWGIAAALSSLGDTARLRRDFATARRHYSEAVVHFRAIDYRQEMLMALAGLALVADAEGQADRAIRLNAAVASLGEGFGAILWTAKRDELDRSLDALRATVAPDAFAAAWDAGQALALDDALALALRERDPASVSPAPDAIGTHLLSPTPLIGRETTLATAVRLLTSERVPLLTIVGPGGIGKSHFALALGRQVQQWYPDGVQFVALAALSEPQGVPAAIAQALGLVAQDQRTDNERIAVFLGARRMVLILDNFEHVLGATPTVEFLLARCPDLTIVITSRAPLRLRREREFPLPPLALPTARDTATIASAPAMQLLAARARAIRADFAVTDVNAATLAAICARLDGLPLALELAAARLRVLDPAALLAGLEARTVALRSTSPDLPERHQTLQRTIAWSYDLLSPGEQRLFRCLGVFHGGATLDALASVAGIPFDDALDGTDRLATHSLVRVVSVEGSATRLVPLETLREFALARLVELGEDAVARDALITHLLAMLDGADDGVIGPERARWQALLNAEEANVRTALGQVAARGDAGAGLQLCWAIWRFWFDRGQGAEARGWIDRFIALDGPAEWRARGLFAGGLIAVWQFDSAAAERYLCACLALANEHGFWRWQAAALTQLGHVARQAGEIEAAAAHYAAALALRRQFGDQREIALSLLGLGYTSADLGDLAAAEVQLTEALELLRAWGDVSEEANTLSYLADVASKRGDAVTARAHLVAALHRWWQLGASGRILTRLGGLASGCADAAPVETLRLLSALHALADHLRLLAASSAGARQTALVATLRDRLGPIAAAAAWTEGDTADPDTITTLAVAMLARRAERHTPD